MTPEEIYNVIKDLKPFEVKKWYADNKITDQDKQAYKNYKNAKSVLKSRQKNKESYNQYQNALMKKRRQADRDADNEKQRIYNKTYRDKIKKEETELKRKQDINDIIDKAVEKLTNAIKCKIAIK